MKRSLICVTLTTALMISAALAQDFTVHMTDQDGKPSTHYVSHNAVRYVASNPVQIDVIYRIDKGTIIHVDHQQKTYSEITLAEARQQAAAKSAHPNPAMARFGASLTPTITRIGAGDAVAGYPTEKYSIKTGITQSEAWVTPALELPTGYYDMVAASLGSQSGGFGQLLTAMKKNQIKGYLLKSVGTSTLPMMKGVTFTTVATSVEKSAIPASTFEVPAGYRKVQSE
jgi:hypothetical protein